MFETGDHDLVITDFQLPKMDGLESARSQPTAIHPKTPMAIPLKILIVEASVSETLTHGTSRTEYRLRHKNGGFHWVEASQSPLSTSERVARRDARLILFPFCVVTRCCG